MPSNPRKPAPDPAPPGPHLLEDRGGLSAWFMRYMLDREVDRARRYGRPFAILRATPDALAGQPVPPAALSAAVSAALVAARRTDFVGWDGPTSLLILMPETSPEEAALAARRWSDEIWVRTRATGGYKWHIALVEGPDGIADLLGYVPEPLSA
ncbi:MAG TPA: hypothetical protein VEZ14_09910 [Dehalococcoidia bacterium]|nr:hypothetical protein [Dehalococcoidia bacterium]